MTTVQNRHCYARLFLCQNCLELAQKHHDVYQIPGEKEIIKKCEVCGETGKVQEVFTTAFNYGI